MAARAIWKGYLKLSLVSCAVALYPAASSSSRVRFNTLNRKTGNRVKRQFVDPETGEAVEADEQVKGYPVGKGSYVLVEEEEIDALKLESTHTIDIESFVPRAEVDERYLDTPYYLAPDDRVAQEAFAVIRDAIREKRMAGLGRVVMARREHLILLEPLDKGLLGTTLHYAYEVRDQSTVFEDIPEVDYPKEMRELAAHIIERKAGHFDPSLFEDRYENALIELVKSKQTGAPVRTSSAPKASNVVNLIDALRKSLDAEKGAPAKPKSAGKTSTRAPAAKKAAPPKTAPQAKGKSLKRAS
ncbi:Ku protein [Salinarimonas soli]|uniref:Non-homologous end joining protein Ku n=1 Tax=Salinarimonas soli TaxID=1638099 RepID=A0A5B2VBK3_9HYPH|nr:Ku protein [Salinarimonas soli]KAA2235557.1 Ku protein [Salinarimonas soli]